MGSTLKGYSPAEAALYWAADHAQPGAAVEVLLTSGEALTVRMAAPYSRRAERRFREAVLHVNADDEGVTASPPAEAHLRITLRSTAFGARDAAPLSLNLPAEVALVIIAATGQLVHARPEPKALSVECSQLRPRASGVQRVPYAPRPTDPPPENTPSAGARKAHATAMTSKTQPHRSINQTKSSQKFFIPPPPAEHSPR